MNKQLQQEREQIREELIRQYGPVIAWMAEILRKDGKWKVSIPGHGIFDIKICGCAKEPPTS